MNVELIISIASVFGILSAELYLRIMAKLILRLGVKADIPRIIVAVIFVITYIYIFSHFSSYLKQNDLFMFYGQLLLVPLWNFGTYIILNWKRARVVLGPISVN